jgi:hypothetical protein
LVGRLIEDEKRGRRTTTAAIRMPRPGAPHAFGFDIAAFRLPVFESTRQRKAGGPAHGATCSGGNSLPCQAPPARSPFDAAVGDRSQARPGIIETHVSTLGECGHGRGCSAIALRSWPHVNLEEIEKDERFTTSPRSKALFGTRSVPDGGRACDGQCGVACEPPWAYHSFGGEAGASNTPRYAALPFHAATKLLRIARRPGDGGKHFGSRRILTAVHRGMALMISRIGHSRKPPVLAGGRWNGAMTSRSASVRSFP